MLALRGGQTGSFPLGYEYKRDGFNPRFDISAIPEVYIWRTAGDSRVSAEHAANEGKHFTRDNPPPTGHPGQCYGCRCVAEEYFAEQEEYSKQTIASSIYDRSYQWSWADVAAHFFGGGGSLITLADMGRKQQLIDFYFYTEGAYQRINQQIVEKAQKQEAGRLSYDFRNSYASFSDLFYPFGGGVVAGYFEGTVKRKQGYLYIEGTIEYKYTDVFTDPYRLRDRVFGDTSDPDAVSEAWRWVSDTGGRPYPIEDDWVTRFEAVVKEE